MNIALIEHAENDVHGHQRRQDQVGLALQGALKGLGGTLEVAVDRRGQTHLYRSPVDGSDGIAECRTGCEIERQRHCRKLTLMLDRKIGYLLSIELDHRR